MQRGTTRYTRYSGNTVDRPAGSRPVLWSCLCRRAKHSVVYHTEGKLVKWFLFQTRLGDMLLALFEQLTGLAIMDNKHQQCTLDCEYTEWCKDDDQRADYCPARGRGL